LSFVAALLYALLMAALPLIEVVHSGRPPATILLLYWFETVLLLVTGAIRIVVHRRLTAKADWRAGRMKLPVHDDLEFIPLPPDPPREPPPAS